MTDATGGLAGRVVRQHRIEAGVGAAKPLRAALSEWQAAVVRLESVDPFTTELVRLRCAYHHDCHT